MNLYFDLNTGLLVPGIGQAGSVRVISFKRGDGLPLKIYFLRGTEAATLEATPMIRFGVKDVIDGELLVFCETFSVGAEAHIYEGSVNTNTTELLAWVTGYTKRDGVAEITVSFDGGVNWQSTAVELKATVLNDVLKEDETEPEDIGTMLPLRYDVAQSLTAPQKAQVQANAGLIIGTHVQAYDSDLATIAGQTNNSFGLTLLTKASGSAVLTYIGGAGLTTNTFTGAQTAPAWLLDTSNKELRAGSNTLTSADNGKAIYLTSSGSTQTLPTGLPFGFCVSLYNTSAGDITLAIDSGISVNGSSASITLAPRSKLDLTPTVDGGGGVIAFRAIASREPLSASTVWGRSSTGGAGEKTVTDFAWSLLDDSSAAAAATTLGLGTGSSVTFASLTLTTALAISSGGTGATTASGARSNFGLGSSDSVTHLDLTVDAVKFTASKIVSVTSTRDLANSDNGKTLVVTGSSAVTLTVPSGLTAGFRCEIINELTGAVACTIAASSTTLNGAAASLNVPLGVRAAPCYVSSNAYEVLFDGRRPPVFAYRSTLPVADYTSASGANQCWLTEVWNIAAQTNGLNQLDNKGGIQAKGKFVIHETTGVGKSLQLLPAIAIVGGAISGSLRDLGSYFGDFVFNINAGSVDLLANTVSSRLKICGSGAASQKLRYKFNTNFSANAGDVIVMSPSGHTFIVDDTITDATAWTSVSAGGVSVRSISAGTPTTSDTSLTVNGGSPITTTYVANTATNSGTAAHCCLFVSSTGVHIVSNVFGNSGFFELIATL